MIKVFNTGYGDSEARFIPLDEVNIVSQQINEHGAPYILFEHGDYPLGALRAEFNGFEWECDLN